MGEIKDFVRLYIENSDILEEFTHELAGQLETDIKSQLYEGHGYDTGNLRRNIRTDERIHKNYSIVTGYYDEGNADYGIYVLRGIRGKGKAKAGKIDFLNDGLNKTLEAYQ